MGLLDDLLQSADLFLMSVGLLPRTSVGIMTPLNSPSGVKTQLPPPNGNIRSGALPPPTSMIPTASPTTLGISAQVGDALSGNAQTAVGKQTSATNNITGQVVRTGQIPLDGNPVKPEKTVGSIHVSSDGTDGGAGATAYNQYMATHPVSADQEAAHVYQLETNALNSLGPLKALAPGAGAVLYGMSELSAGVSDLMGWDAGSPDQTQVPPALMAAHNATCHGIVPTMPDMNASSGPMAPYNSDDDTDPTNAPSLTFDSFVERAIKSSVPIAYTSAAMKISPGGNGAPIVASPMLPVLAPAIATPTPPLPPPFVAPTEPQRPNTVRVDPKSPIIRRAPYNYPGIE